MPSKAEKAFSRHWYHEVVAKHKDEHLHWRGVPIVKSPHDLLVYQEILWRTKPDHVIETGTFKGGSALYLAHVADALGLPTRITSIDIHSYAEILPSHDRIEFWLGRSSTDPVVLGRLKEHVDGRCMVILDSDHSKHHVLRELQLYAPLVAKGCYLIVEDTNRDGYFLGGGYEGQGPAEALREWQPTNKGFVADRYCERLGFTQNPGGYLERVR